MKDRDSKFGIKVPLYHTQVTIVLQNDCVTMIMLYLVLFCEVVKMQFKYIVSWKLAII